MDGQLIKFKAVATIEPLTEHSEDRYQHVVDDDRQLSFDVHWRFLSGLKSVRRAGNREERSEDFRKTGAMQRSDRRRAGGAADCRQVFLKILSSSLAAVRHPARPWQEKAIAKASAW